MSVVCLSQVALDSWVTISLYNMVSKYECLFFILRLDGGGRVSSTLMIHYVF